MRGILTFLFLPVGIIFALHTIAAEVVNTSGSLTYYNSGDTTNTVTTSATPTTFAVTPLSTVDCGDPLRPTTSISFVADPMQGGSFSLSSNNAQSVRVDPGTKPLPNGTYTWRAIVNPSYAGSGKLEGDFVLNAKCATATNTSVLPVATTTTGETTESTTIEDTTTNITQEPAPMPKVSFSVASTTVINCFERLRPTTNVSFIVNPSNGGSFKISTSTAARPLILKGGIHPLPNGDYLWSAVVNQYYQGISPLSGKFILKASCPTPISSTPVPAPQALSPGGESISPQGNLITPLSSKDQTVQAIQPTPLLVSSGAVAPLPPKIPVKEILSATSRAEKREILTRVKDSAMCTSIKECAVFCEQESAKSPYCAGFTRKEVNPALAVTREEVKKVFSERVGARVFIDSDTDGISDYDEVNIYHTDPEKVDTNGNGLDDGDELIARQDPLERTGAVSTTTSVRGEVAEKDPLIAGNTEPKLLKVDDVSVAKVATSTPDARATALTIRGTALPNSFITLYIFSEPIVVTIKTNDLGEWTYTLDKELPDGNHQVISAITDSGGKILAKSEPLPFVKVAEAVTVGRVDLALASTRQEPGFFAGVSLYALIAIIIGIVGSGFLIIGMVVKSHPEGGDTTPTT